MSAMDSVLLERLSREMHPVAHDMSTDLMTEAATGDLCPWTLMLTLALTVIKGLLPLAPKAVPLIVSDPEKRAKAVERISGPDFINNFDDFFIDSIKKNFQAPLNEEILKSSEAVSLFSQVLEGLMGNFNVNTNDDSHLMSNTATDTLASNALDGHRTPKALDVHHWLTVDNVAKVVRVAKAMWT